MNAEKESQVVACWTQLLRESLGKVFKRGAFAKIPTEQAELGIGRFRYFHRGIEGATSMLYGGQAPDRRATFERISMQGPIICLKNENPAPPLLHATDEAVKQLSRVVNVDLRNHLVKFCKNFRSTSRLEWTLNVLRLMGKIDPEDEPSVLFTYLLDPLEAKNSGIEMIPYGPALRTNKVRNADSPWVESMESFIAPEGFGVRMTRRWKNAKWEAVILFWGIPMRMVHQGDLPEIQILNGPALAEHENAGANCHDFYRARTSITRAWVPMDTDNIICVFVRRKLSWRQKWENLTDDVREWAAWGNGLLKFLREDAA